MGYSHMEKDTLGIRLWGLENAENWGRVQQLLPTAFAVHLSVHSWVGTESGFFPFSSLKSFGEDKKGSQVQPEPPQSRSRE